MLRLFCFFRNNRRFARQLLELGMAQDTGFYNESGFCAYPLRQFAEESLGRMGQPRQVCLCLDNGAAGQMPNNCIRDPRETQNTHQIRITEKSA